MERVSACGLAELSVLSHRLWRATYVPDMLSEPDSELLWRRGYEIQALQETVARGETLLWVLFRGHIVGFCGYKPASVSSVLQLTKLYLYPSCWGKGLGRFSVLVITSYARVMGYRSVELYVFRKNTRAIKAYQRSGFRIDRADFFEVAPGVGYDDFRMVIEFDGKTR